MLCIYHIADHDGKGSAAIVKSKFPEIELMGLNHDMEIPYEEIEKHDKLVICDIALPVKYMLELNKKIDLTWIDHHVSVIKEYDEEYQTSVIDIDAAMSDTSVNPVQNKVVKKYIDELKEIELTKHTIEGIDASRVQCFVKNNVAYVNGTIIYEPNAGVMGEGEFLAIENLPIPAYNGDLLVYMQYFGTDESASGVECAINKNGQLHIYGTTLPAGIPGLSIVIVVTYPIA